MNEDCRGTKICENLTSREVGSINTCYKVTQQGGATKYTVEQCGYFNSPEGSSGFLGVKVL